MANKKVAIIMGSDSDWSVLEVAETTLQQFNVEVQVLVASAHRTPERVHDFVSSARENGIGVIIAAAGAAAHLPGVIAAYTTLPVIGVPIDATTLGGMDALLSIAQMPSGIPVGTMAINGAKNAALYAVEMLAVSDETLMEKLAQHRQEMAAEVEKKATRLDKLRADKQIGGKK